MATTETAIVPAVQLDQYAITVRELDQLGRATEYQVPAPTSPDWGAWTLMQQVAMLKRGPWAKYPITDVIFAIAYAQSLHLDITQGDVYAAGDGRIATSNKAKIKLALATGNIIGIETDTVELAEPAPAGCTGAAKDLECTVVLTIKGWSKPIINKARLSHWYKAKNPNWVGNPRHMLKLNAIAHACELVHPSETGEDELPTAADVQL